MPVLLPIKGDGFIIRDFQQTDAESLAEIEFNPLVKQFLSLPKKSVTEWIEAVRRDGIYGWVIQADNGQVAGSGTLSRTKRKGIAELRIVIGKQFWGASLGSKVAKLLVGIAFSRLSAKSILAVIHPNNKASLSIVRALKFRRRGVISELEQSWQIGHYIYRLTKSVYLSSLN